MNHSADLNRRDHGHSRRLIETGRAFLRLGCMSFGGPVAHLGYFREEFVVRRGWLEDAAYSDLVALCQFLPGPASSQVAFGLGMQRAGIAGALVASLCFTMPSAILMILFACGVGAAGDLRHAGWLHGLKLAAVAVVAQAVWGMGRKLCPDRTRIAVALLAAGMVLSLPGPGAQIGVIAAGAATGWLLYRGLRVPDAPASEKFTRNHLWAIASLVAFAVFLFLVPVIAGTAGGPASRLFDSFYRAGSLVFGGGHVVLPLLRAELVPSGLVSDNVFLAGYGAAQAVPGPLFTFAAYLGAVIVPGPHAWLWGLWCLFAIFLPAWLLVAGALPFWHLVRGKAWAQAALCGANAAVVGVLLAALYNPVWKQGVTDARDAAAALGALALLEVCRLPPWLVVILAAATGQWIL